VKLSMNRTLPRVWANCALAAVVLATLPNAGACAEEAKKAETPKPPRVTSVRVEQPPKIDGVLDDPCWQQAAHLDGFYREEKDLPATEPTDAYICQDAGHLYVAFRCHDSRVDQIKATQRKRNGTMHLDDSVALQLDTYHEHRDAYWFEVNPRGTQNEDIPGGAAPKIEWQGDWRAAARINSDGWTAEIAIPFKILRYPNGPCTWGMALQRKLAREQEWSIWPRMHGVFNPEMCADLTGLQLPPYHEPTVLLPYTLTESSTDTGNRLHFGLDVKRPLASGLRLYGTYRPDFRDIENVVETIDFSYTERWLPERRPFFIEAYGDGSSIVLYTRRIGDIREGIGVIGRTGRHEAGVLYVNAFDQGNIFAVQHGYQLAPASEVSWALSGQQGAENPDHVTFATGLDLGRNTKVGTDSMLLRYYASRSAGAGGNDAIWRISGSRSRGQGRVSLWANYTEIGADFNDILAYVPEKGVRKYTLSADSWSRRETGRIRTTSWWSSFDGADSLIGDPSYYFVDVGAGREFRNHRSQSIGAHYGRRERFTDAAVNLSHGWNVNDLYRCGSVYGEIGRRLAGTSLFASARQGLKLSDSLALQISAEYLYMTSPIEPEKGHQIVLTGAYDLSNERTISGRLVGRRQGTNFYMTYRQAVRRGMDMYVIVGDPNADTFTRRIAIKAVWAVFP
jgi:hypothetical protein